MRVFMMMTSIIVLFIQISTVYVTAMTDKEIKEKNSWRKLHIYAEEIYRYGVVGKAENIRSTVVKMSQLLLKTTFNSEMTVEGVRALSDAMIQVKRIAHSTQETKKKLLHATARLRLATDTLVHPQQAMWLQYEPVLRNDLVQLLSSKQRNVWIIHAHRWLEHMDRIQPAAMMQRDEQIMEMISSMQKLIFEAINNKRDFTIVSTALHNSGSFILEQLFEAKKINPALALLHYQPIPWKWIFIIACIVCIMLSYVAYQQYRYERHAIRLGNFVFNNRKNNN